MGIPAAFFHGKDLGKLFIHAGYGSFRLRIFCGAGAQDIDLFKFLQSVPEFFKPQGTEIAGINKVAVSRGPVPEIRLFKRIAVPGIISPSQKAVQMIGGGKEGKPFRLRQRRNSEGVGLFGMDTDIERRLFSLLFALRQQIARDRACMVNYRRDVINVPGHGRRPIEGGNDFEFRGILVQHILGRPDHSVRPFIQPDAGFAQPALALDVLAKIRQERPPDSFIGGIVRLKIQKFVLSGRLIQITDFHVPGNHGIAGYLPLDAHLVHHEGNPLVKIGVIPAHGSVFALDPFNHGREPVISLGIPGFINQGACNGLLPGIRQPFHHRLHQREMLRRPRFHIMPAGHGLRMLP